MIKSNTEFNFPHKACLPIVDWNRERLKTQSSEHGTSVNIQQVCLLKFRKCQSPWQRGLRLSPLKKNSPTLRLKERVSLQVIECWNKLPLQIMSRNDVFFFSPIFYIQTSLWGYWFKQTVVVSACLQWESFVIVLLQSCHIYLISLKCMTTVTVMVSPLEAHFGDIN